MKSLKPLAITLLGVVGVFAAVYAVPDDTKRKSLLVLCYIFVAIGLIGWLGEFLPVFKLFPSVWRLQQLGIDAIHLNGMSGLRFSKASTDAAIIRIRATAGKAFLFDHKPALIDALVKNRSTIRVMLCAGDSEVVRAAEKLESPDGHRDGQITNEIEGAERLLREYLAEARKLVPQPGSIGRVFLAYQSSSYRLPLIMCDSKWVWLTLLLPPRRAVQCPAMELRGGGILSEMCLKHFEESWALAETESKCREISPS